MRAAAANPLAVDKATHDECNRLYAGIEPVPVYIELDTGVDHDAIERELDEQMGIEPKPRRERSWDCLAGEAPVACQHNRLTTVREEGRVLVKCACGHSWMEFTS